MEVIWRHLRSNERYEVSSIGGLRLIDGTEVAKQVGKYISYYVDGVKTYAHRLVAAEFCEGYGPVVNHIDEDKHNNDYRNLEWCTVAHNNRHSKSISGSLNYGGRRHDFSCLSEFCRDNELDKGAINAVIKGRRNHHKGWSQWK